MVASTSKISIVLLLLLFAISFNSSMSIKKVDEIRCNEKDRWILSIFKQGIVDPSNSLSSWSTEEDCCSWLGVHCDNVTGRVTELDLRSDKSDYDESKALRGEINLSVLQLEFLNYLDLNNNEFETIHIPPINGSTADGHIHHQFSRLHYLDLSYNSIHLRMDNLHWLSYVSSIKYLNLTGIDLQMDTNWLQSISKLSSLLELRLSICQLNNPSSPLGWYVNFTSLKVLDLSSNNLGFEILRYISALNASLSHLFLSGNFLRGQIPDTLSNLQHLETLDLFNNELNGLIPDWLGQFKYLKSLDLSNNSFYGTMPLTLGNLSSLTHLSIYSNHLSGRIPNSWSKLRNLNYLDLHDNSFHGPMPSTLKNLSSLVHLSLMSNHLSGLIPDWLGQLKHLHFVALSENSFSGPIPTTLANLSSLASLDLASNQLSSLPANFWKFAATIKLRLDISNNLITGDISNIWLNTPWLELHDNNFSGALPFLSPNVTILNVYNNFFTNVSSLLCHGMTEKSNLQLLNASNNLLSGELPNCWFGWKSLLYLNLDNNNLTGRIPDSISSLLNLQFLHLSNNKFFGDIPISLQNNKNLLILNLERNNFSGSIPSWKGQNLTTLVLRSNRLNGTIPSHLCQLSSLIILDLANNRFSGSIPKCLSNITAMILVSAFSIPYIFIKPSVDIDASSNYIPLYYEEVTLLTKGRNLKFDHSLRLVRLFDLSSNELSGSIPLELFGLHALLFLNLSRNQLTGRLPLEIGYMKNLESLDLSWNQLYGEIPQSISTLSFLSVLNLSYNYFSGQIPLGTQLQSFEKYSYIGNPELCGAPLPTTCNNVRNFSGKEPFVEDQNESSMFPGFYIAMEVGFVIGFLGVCIPIFFKRSCGHCYFKFVDDMKDRIYVAWVQR